MTQSKFITCQQLIDFLEAYNSSDLPTADRIEVDRHLKVCPDCVDYLNTYRQTIQMTRDAHAVNWQPNPEEVPEDLIKIILKIGERKPETPDNLPASKTT